MIQNNQQHHYLQALLDQHLIASKKAHLLQKNATQQNISVFEMLHNNHNIDPQAMAQAFGQYFQLRFIDLRHHPLITDPAHRIVEKHLLAFYKQHAWNIVISNPEHLNHAQQLKEKYQQANIFFAEHRELITVINYYRSHDTFAHLHAHQSHDTDIQQLMQQIIHDGIYRRASDIHCECYASSARVRLRIDGCLQNLTKIPSSIHKSLITCLKLNANLDITERRLPQDGRLQFTTRWGDKQDMRISTCPGLHGEKMVLRLLDKRPHIQSFDALGMSPKHILLLKKTLKQQHGIVLVCGPTGSGKSMTLYAILQHLNQSQRNIMTAEDPIEIPIDGIHQVASMHAIQLDFATLLRSFLRQDPDIIMVGEIRDPETASIAIKAANTGHLVFSTLHCNSAASSVQRLEQMEVPPHQLSALRLVIAQRLIRRLCTHCRIPLSAQDKIQLGEKQHLSLYRANPQACMHCHQGYAGRIGIFECWMPPSGAQSETLALAARRLWQQGITDRQTIEAFL